MLPDVSSRPTSFDSFALKHRLCHKGHEVEEAEMTPEDRKRISAWSAGAGRQARVTLFLSDDPRGGDFLAFCDGLSQLAPGTLIVRERAGPGALPGIRIGENIFYRAVPSEGELGPFLEALSRTVEERSAVPPTLALPPEAPPLAAFIRVFVTPECPYCPATVREILSLCAALAFVQVEIIDGTRFQELAQASGIKAVPTVILDGAFRWTGALKAEELLDVLAHRDPSELSAAGVERMLKEGGAADLSEMMIREGEIFQGLIDLLFHASWPVRMGAMVAVEELSARDPELARRVIEPVQARFEEAEDAVKGDLLYVLGELRDERLIPTLRQILEGPYSGDVKEAAQEAMDKLRDPARPPHRPG